MELPIKAVRGTIEGVERIGYLKASQLYKVPRSTLERRNKNGNKIAIGSRKFLGNRKSVLPSINVEVEVGKYVLVEFSGKKGQRGSLRRLHCGNFGGATVYDTIFTEGRSKEEQGSQIQRGL